MDDENYQKARNYVLKLLSLRPRSKSEINKRLSLFVKKKSLPNNLINQVISELVSKNLINDYHFATWWIEQRNILNPKGKKLLKIELRRKGIQQEIIDNVFGNTSALIEKELKLANRIITKKFPLYKHLPKRERTVKLGNLLASRGFDWHTINKVIDSFEEKN